MTNFKINDKVVCINRLPYTQNITVGKTYIVTSIDNEYEITLKNKKGIWTSSQFMNAKQYEFKKELESIISSNHLDSNESEKLNE